MVTIPVLALYTLWLIVVFLGGFGVGVITLMIESRWIKAIIVFTWIFSIAFLTSQIAFLALR